MEPRQRSNYTQLKALKIPIPGGIRFLPQACSPPALDPFTWTRRPPPKNRRLPHSGHWRCCRHQQTGAPPVPPRTAGLRAAFPAARGREGWRGEGAGSKHVLADRKTGLWVPGASWTRSISIPAATTRTAASPAAVGAAARPSLPRRATAGRPRVGCRSPAWSGGARRVVSGGTAAAAGWPAARASAAAVDKGQGGSSGEQC